MHCTWMHAGPQLQHQQYECVPLQVWLHLEQPCSSRRMHPILQLRSGDGHLRSPPSWAKAAANNKPIREKINVLTIISLQMFTACNYMKKVYRLHLGINVRTRTLQAVYNKPLNLTTVNTLPAQHIAVRATYQF